MKHVIDRLLITNNIVRKRRFIPPIKTNYFRNEDDCEIFKMYAIRISIVLIRCPIMSLVATLLFANSGNQIITIWLQKCAFNLLFAIGLQLVICWPLGRIILRKVIR